MASEQISDKYDELDASLMKGNEEEIKDEFLIEFRESLEKFEKERSTIKEKLNKQVQRLFVIQKEKQEYEKVRGSFDVGAKEHEKLAIQGEIVKLRERLEQVNAEIKLINQIVISLQKRS